MACLPPASTTSLAATALAVLSQPDPWTKAAWTEEAAKLWECGEISVAVHGGEGPVMERPSRLDSKVELVAPNKAKKLGRGGSLASRIAIVHSLAHIESWAIDLSWDIIARFGCDPDYAMLPKAFFDDFARVAQDEAKHFRLLAARLEEMGSGYGSLPVHDGLWESARETSGSLAARLAVEHCVHEARGLDVLPQTARRMRAGSDFATAELLENTIYEEEITHCAAGVRWLRFLHQHAMSSACAGESARPEWIADAQQHASVKDWFHALIRTHFHGLLKPPFNDDARSKAGFLPSWYLPLAHEPATDPTQRDNDAASTEGGQPADGLIDPNAE